MTNKIIPDGVNVAGCEFLKMRSLCFKEGYYEDCKNKDCVYKQLQSLKAENEELKKKLKTFFNIDNQECWDLAFVMDEKAKYKQALEKVKEIAAYLLETDDELDLSEVIEKIEEIKKASEVKSE